MPTSVTHNHSLQSEGKTSLKGKTILITRRREQSQELITCIEAHQGNAVVIPLIRIVEPASWEPCDAAIREIGTFDSIVFTSGNAVEKFLQRCEVRGVFSSAFERINIYSVGERTSDKLRDYGIRDSVTPKDYSSASLQEMFQRENAGGRRFLIPVGSLSKRDIALRLRSLNAQVTEVEVYRNSPPSAEILQELSARFLRREFDVVTFASPSAVMNFSDAIVPNLFSLVRHQTKIAVIGGTTRAAAEQYGYVVDIEAHTSTSKGLVDAILEYYS